MSDPKSELSVLDLKVYSAQWCPDCTRFRAWLDGEGVEYEYVDIEHSDGAAEKLEEETGKRAIPFVLVNDSHWVRGYHRELPLRFDPELFVKEATQVIATKP